MACSIGAKVPNTIPRSGTRHLRTTSDAIPLTGRRERPQSHRALGAAAIVASCRPRSASPINGYAEFRIGFYQRTECEATVETTGIWQNPRHGSGEAARILAPVEVRCATHCQQRSLAQEGNTARSITPNFHFKRRLRYSVLTRGHVGRTP